MLPGDRGWQNRAVNGVQMVAGSVAFWPRRQSQRGLMQVYCGSAILMRPPHDPTLSQIV